MHSADYDTIDINSDRQNIKRNVHGIVNYWNEIQAINYASLRSFPEVKTAIYWNDHNLPHEVVPSVLHFYNKKLY